jgi:hypothetical protein
MIQWYLVLFLYGCPGISTAPQACGDYIARVPVSHEDCRKVFELLDYQAIGQLGDLHKVSCMGEADHWITPEELK